MSIQAVANRVASRADRPFQEDATNYVIVVSGNSYVGVGAGVYTPVLAEARVYHSEYAANCAVAQFKHWLDGKTHEILPLRMTLLTVLHEGRKPKRDKKRG